MPLLFLLFAGAVAAMTPEDLNRIRGISELRLSPDGRTAVFRLGTKLMQMPAVGGEPEPISAAPEGAASVRWSPDGRRVAFIAGAAIWVYDFASQRLLKVCEYSRGNSYLARAGNWLAWSPEGARIAFAGTREPAPAAADPLVITRILYKTRTGISDNRRSHIYIVPAAGGEPRALTAGNYDEHSIAWAPGAEVVYLSNRGPDPDAHLNYDLFAADPATGAERQLTRTPGVETSPAVSPDGKRIAYAATRRAHTTIDSVAEDSHVWTLPGGELNARLDRRSFEPSWQGDAVLYLAHDRGRTLVYRGTRPLFDAGAQVSAYSAAAGVVIVAMSTPVAPPEIYRIDDGRPVQLTRFNAGVVERPVAPETLRFRSFDGTPVEGWLYLPPGGGRVPAVLAIHGGPHGMFGYGFNARAQLYASRGYATLLVNPRGSAGYGQKFSDGCVQDWGGGDYRDLMSGVDSALKKYPRLDPARLAVTGGSYGGYMTNWVITQTNRFKAAVPVASLSNLISFYATSLYQDLMHVEFGGYPWAPGVFERLWRRSPLKHVANVKTPALFLHGERDNEVHITQAEEMYTALRQRGIETVLVRYPREGHGIAEPKHVADMERRTLDWFDRFVK